jgi:hypothetical protein
MTTNIDDEWMQFLMQNNAPIGKSVSNYNSKPAPLPVEKPPLSTPSVAKSVSTFTAETPKCNDLYISTKTKVLFLNSEININQVFWQIPIIEYWLPKNGVVKKQMKIVSKTPEEYEEYTRHLEGIPYYVEHVIKQINNPAARRIKFKDERKITVGISKKDIMNCRGKVKNAFYNCFAMILRFQYEGVFREIHVKIFNTGKMEIPGIPTKELMEFVKQMILDTLRPHMNEGLDFVDNANEDSVLINSNFNCGFYIHREKLQTILRNKYKIEAAYDPCSYPGLKCKYYFNHEKGFDSLVQRGLVEKEDHKQKLGELDDNKRYTEVSFMIFRTGSCLIVGNCSEPVLRFIFEFIKNILMTERDQIITDSEEPVVKNKKPKIRKRTVMMTPGYFHEIQTKDTNQ